MTVKHAITDNKATLSVQELIDILNQVEDKNTPLTIFTDLRVHPYMFYPIKVGKNPVDFAKEHGYFAIHIETLKGKRK